MVLSPRPIFPSKRATMFWLVEGSGGLNLSALLGTFKTPLRFAVVIETVAVMPGLSFSSGFGTLTMAR